MNRLEDFLTLSQKELFSKLRKMYKNTAIYCKDRYILVPGDAPIMLLAHLDTVHHECVKQICKTENGSILMSPQGIGGDDRCGVYALVKLHRMADKKPWLLFTCDEETGGIGASTFCAHYGKSKLPEGLAEIKLLVELDRKGEKDAVYYNCENDEFEEYITSKGFKTEWGSFSDISIIAPKLGVAAVNLSSGYHNAHTLHERINRNHLNAVVKKVNSIIADSVCEDFPKYEYVESKYKWGDDFYTIGHYNSRHDGVYGKDYIWPKDTDDGEAAILDEVPTEILEEYIALLDFHSAVELEELRLEYGNSIIKILYQDEMGFSSKQVKSVPRDY